MQSVTRKTDVLKVLGERVATLRRERDFTQEQLAERAGVSRNHIAGRTDEQRYGHRPQFICAGGATG